MRLLTVTNLYPRPDEPQRGLFNAQQFRAMADALAVAGGIANVCLVPEWRVWRWGSIRGWRDPFEARFHTRYVPVFYVPGIGRDLSWRTYAAALRAARPEMPACDAVLASWLYPDAVAVDRVAQDLRKPLWIKVHGSDRFHLEHAARRGPILAACARAAGILCNCRFLAARLVGAGVDAGKIHVVPNGVDAARFRYRTPAEARGELRARGRSGGDARLVLFVGNLVPVKGPDVMLESWRRLAAAGRRLLVIGDGPLRGRLEKLARKLRLGDTVAFLGRRPHDEIALWMNAADALCLTSRSEGMPNVIVEALASGLPVVATDVGACGEVLGAEPAARVSAGAGGPQAVADALRDLLDRRIDRAALARRHAARFSWQRNAGEVLNLMQAARERREGA